MVEIDKNLNVWREYQRRIQRNGQRSVARKILPWVGLWAGICLLALIIVVLTGPWIFAHLNEPGPSRPGDVENIEEPQQLSKTEVTDLLLEGTKRVFPLEQKYYIQNNGSLLQVETSIDPDLQEYVKRLIDRSPTYRTAVVVMRPDTGQILALANHADLGRQSHENLCLKAEFPAASLFKIVAAAAAIEARGFTPETTVSFRGQKYTLYKSQLRQSKGRYSKKMTLREAFGDSVNPFFGKMGIYHLGQDLMTEYADRFLFNQLIPFDLPVSMSSIEVPDDDFGLAEIASGFNKRTVMSPLHAALMTATVANGGVMMAPWLVKSIKDESGNVLYNASPSALASPITEATARELKVLMEETVIAGTCRKTFRILQRRHRMKDVELGAKTGTIRDQLGEHKCEWLTAFALPVNGEPGLAVAALTVHGERLGVRAKDIAKKIIQHQFSYEG
jgi:cell division protein FtsI/penicillin-binding protein 2